MSEPLAIRLVRDLNRAGVRYCHWKSNVSLAESIEGGLDVDLLVERSDHARMVEALEGLGYKRALPANGRELPAVTHYYGYDPGSEALSHVHLFTSVVTGESFVKSHHLPLERMLLDDGATLDEFKVPAPEAELVLFVLRMFIKYGSPADVLRLVPGEREIREECAWLRGRGRLERSLELLREHVPMVDERLFGECLEAISEGKPLFTRLRLARRMRRALRSCRLRGSLAQAWGYVMLTGPVLRKLLRLGKQRKRLHSGGAVIAVVGPEATGKSTLVNACRRWLGQALKVSSVHIGKPAGTLMTGSMNLVAKPLRALKPELRSRSVEARDAQEGSADGPSERPGQRRSLAYALRAVTLAVDRRRLVERIHRRAARGEIVVCDRYPAEVPYAMDSQRLEEREQARSARDRLYNWLARLERRQYQAMPPPDLALRLTVSLEVAQERNRTRIKAGKESAEFVEFRHLHSAPWSRGGTRFVHDIDTDQSLEHTLAELKRLVWKSL